MRIPSRIKMLLKIAGPLVGLAILANTVFVPWLIRSRIEHLHPAGLSIRIDHIRAAFFSQSVRFSGVSLFDPGRRLNLTVEYINFDKINVFSFLSKRQINFGELRVEKPRIRVFRDFALPDSVQKSPPDSSSVSALIAALKIDEADFCLFGKSDRDTLFASRLTLNVTTLAIKPETPTRFVFKNLGIDRLSFSISDFAFYPASRQYRLQFDSLYFDSEMQGARVHGMKLLPTTSRYEPGEKSGFQSDWFNVSIASVEVNEFDIDRFFANGLFKIRSVQIDSLNAETFRDTRLPIPEKPDTKLFSDLVASIPVPLCCDSLRLGAANIRYSERVPDSDQAGHIDFSNLYARLIPLCNIDSLISRPAALQVKTHLMGQALLELSGTFANARFPGANELTGSMQNADFSIFNPITIPNLSAKVESGKIDRLTFRFRYDNEKATGDFDLRYHHLKIDLLKREDQSNQRVKSFLLNSLLVRTDNLPGKHHKAGHIACERDPKKSVFNFWWKAVLSGIKSVVI